MPMVWRRDRDSIDFLVIQQVAEILAGLDLLASLTELAHFIAEVVFITIT